MKLAIAATAAILMAAPIATAVGHAHDRGPAIRTRSPDERAAIDQAECRRCIDTIKPCHAYDTGSANVGN